MRKEQYIIITLDMDRDEDEVVCGDDHDGHGDDDPVKSAIYMYSSSFFFSSNVTKVVGIIRFSRKFCSN